MEFVKEQPGSYRKILERQIKILREMPRGPDLEHNPRWRAQRDYSIALARDVIKQVLPPDSALYALHAKATEPPTDQPTNTTTTNEYELQLYESALASLDWSSTSNTSGTFPSTVSVFSEVSRALPEIVYKHWTFKVILAVLTAIAIFAATGVLKFYSITLDLKQEILDKEATLSRQLETQQKDIDAFQKTRKAQADEISDKISNLNLILTGANKQIGELEMNAQATIARLTSQAGRKVDAEVDQSLGMAQTTLAQHRKEAADRIDEYWAKEAQPSLKRSADTRVAEILADGWKPFQDKLREFDLRAVNATKTMSELEARQKVLDGKQLLVDKASPLLAQAHPDAARRLSAYIGEAIWVIYGGATLAVVLVVVNIVLIVLIVRNR